MPVDARHTSLADYVRIDSPDLFTKAVRFQDFLVDGRRRDFEKYLFQYVAFRGGTALIRDRIGDTVREVQVYCSADYLDFARHPAVIDAAHRAIDQFGVSVSSVPLIAGSTVLHGELERELANFLGAESCVLFPSGQAANVSTIAALCSSNDFVLIDKQVHYSVLEGVKLAGSRWRSFRHSDAEHLDVLLRSVRRRHANTGILVIAEGVYGLDGDIAPLSDLFNVAKSHGARFLLDDAHATGVIGPRGAGTADYFGMTELPDIVMGSLSKAFGSIGGFVAARKDVAEYLRYFAKSISFSIGLPPANAAAALRSLRCIQDDPSHLKRLATRHNFLREMLLGAGFADVAGSESAIMSILVGSEAIVKETTRDLFNLGVWVEGLPFPAVARGQERIRFRARVSHTDDEITSAVQLVIETARKHGFLNRRVASVGSFGALNSEASNTGRLLELNYESGARRSLPPSWFTPESKRKLIEKGDFWEELPLDQRWFMHGGRSLSAAVCAFATSHNGSIVGGLGQIAWLPGQDAALASCINDGLKWLRASGAREVYAPWHAPMQLLGAGLPLAAELPESRPFLETTNDPQLNRILPECGFKQVWFNHYFKLALEARTSPAFAPQAHTIRFRDLDREHLQRDVSLLTPLLNATVSTLPHCVAISERTLYGVATELRDLFVPGLWRLAFKGDDLVGFVASFPNVTEAFSQADGMADVADLVKISDALDQVDEGFVAWMGISPRFAEPEQLAAELIRQVFTTMVCRGFKSTWVSWELHNGRRQMTEADFASQKVDGSLDYQVYRLRW